jgi:nitroimidazol reductase NimA-like FMN-containing flavoprotein (pyridoxamine 5'-phosphate oxidase superfamily)
MDNIEQLSAQECRTLLLSESVGRVAFATPSGTRLVPITYLMSGESVHFRISAFSELATFAPDSEVSFEIDRIDPAERRGWSVVVRGQCRTSQAGLDAQFDDIELRGNLPEWERPLTLVVECEHVTGRRMGGVRLPGEDRSDPRR